MPEHAPATPLHTPRDLIDRAADALFVHDDEGRFLDVNDRACELLGYSREDLLSRSLDDIEPDFDRHGIRARLRALRPGHSLLVEGAPTRRDGSRVPVEVSVSVLSAEEPRRYVALVRDTTERARREETLRRDLTVVREQLLRVERFATLGTLAGGVGHDLNNIATVLDFCLRALRRAAEAGAPPPRHVLDQLTRCFEHVGMHARQLLTLGRPARDQNACIDVRDVARAAITLLRTAGRLGHVDVRFECVDGDASAIASAARLEQVLINLLRNADDAVAEAGREHGIVVVSVDLDADGKNVVVCVEDNGPGIAEHCLPLVFDPYYTTKPPDRGTGLGLSVTRQIVDAWGGAIDISSRAGEGITVRFTIPRAEPAVRHASGIVPNGGDPPAAITAKPPRSSSDRRG